MLVIKTINPYLKHEKTRDIINSRGRYRALDGTLQCADAHLGCHTFFSGTGNTLLLPGIRIVQ